MLRVVFYCVQPKAHLCRVGYRLNFIDFDSDSDSFRFPVSIPM